VELRIFNSKRKEIILAYRRLFNTEDGKLVLNDMCKMCHFNASTFDPDPYQSANNEGKREVILRIMRTVESDPRELFKFLEGNQEE